MHRKIEIVVSRDRVTVCYRGRSVSEFGIDADSDLLVRKNNTTDVAEEVDSFTNLRSISVDVITFEESKDSIMALPKAHRRSAKTESIIPEQAKKRYNDKRDFDSISQFESKSILNEILASLKNNPHQTTSERAKETHRIATKLGVRPMAVAGVRANMARGVYGKVTFDS